MLLIAAVATLRFYAAYALAQRGPRGAAQALLLACALFTSVPVALIVANLGTLFRLRVMFLAPILIVAGVGGLAWRRRAAQAVGGRPTSAWSLCSARRLRRTCRRRGTIE